jgi:adenylosuccinate lyase
MAEYGELWQHPLSGRYASTEMLTLLGELNTARLWRRLWLALAEAEQELGLAVSDEAVSAIRQHLDDADLERAHAIEAETRHDVMAHIKHLAEQAPEAAGIIHWGATSCFVSDNAALIQYRDGLKMLLGRASAAVKYLRDFALEYKDMPTLAYTHMQAAQPTTVGKRATLWIYDLLLDAEELERTVAWLPFRSVKGTTGTQASFLQLFNVDFEKVRKLEKRVAEKMGFDNFVPVSGQTYTRKVDTRVLSALAGIGETVAKFGNDLRFLQHMKEVEEPFKKTQVGSSAMPYKRNPMRAERLCGLGRYLAALPQQAAQVSTSQWLERTLDDSAPRRMYISESLLLADACLILLAEVAKGLVVHPEMVRKHVDEEMPFMASEAIMMAAVEKGGNRQELHEVIRKHAQAAADKVKEGGRNDLIERLAKDPAFKSVKNDIPNLSDPAKFVGAAPMQVGMFIEENVNPFLKRVKPVEAESAPQI